ncbi:hypothetical protein, partial [Agathobaculum sp.]|uniref:hypothetical protein n=1 Tax=Agathobaculum sp. TaxID=2048138 RepID=UPI003AB688E4
MFADRYSYLERLFYFLCRIIIQMFAARTDNNFVRVAIVVKIDSQKPVACIIGFIRFYMSLNIYLFSMVDICILAHQFRVFP